MMSSTVIKALQRSLTENGFNTNGIDGIWGKGSQNALEASSEVYDIAWSNKVSTDFVEKVKVICTQLNTPAIGPDSLMSSMAFETGRTFSPTIKNGAGAPYYGLCQFGAAALSDQGLVISDILKMSAVEQLDVVYRFFKPYAGKLQDLPSFYMRIIWPAAVNLPDSTVIWSKATRPTTYLQNKGLDLNRDGLITRAEISQTIWDVYGAGMLIENRRKK